MQGGNTLVLNSNGSTKSVQLFAPYGSVRYSDGTSPTAHNYTGQRLDNTTGLLYYNARYYDPISGCFTSTDTVETNATGSDPYAYVDDNPETKTDPTGQMMYDPATGQAGRVVNGKAEVWQYNSGIDSSGTSDTTSQVVASNIWSIYTWTWWTPPVYDVNWAPPVTHSAPVKHTSDASQDPDRSYCPGSTAAMCTNTMANYALYLGPYSISVPGLFNPFSVHPDGGDEESGTGTGGSGAQDDGGDTDGTNAEDCGPLSFIATTSVATMQGEQAIGTLKVGEKVWAYNPNTKKMEFEPILHVWINHDNDLVDLTITYIAKQGKTTKPASEVIHTNKKHPFLTVEKGFLPVGQIKLGMHVVEADGQRGVVSGWKVVPGVKTMYNLEVAQDHTFVVGVGMWVVHNEGPCWFRGGNKTESKIDHVRFEGENIDITQDEEGNVEPGTGGVSINSDPNKLGSRKPWIVGDLPEGLQIRLDHGTHALIEPSYKMPAPNYIELLRQIRMTKGF
jgi:RHS repeat-associated protein